MPIYILLAFAAAFFFSLNAIFAKLTSKYAITKRNYFLFYFALSQLLFLPIIFFITDIQNPVSGLVPLLLFSVMFFIGNYFIITVLFRYDISILQSFFHFQTVLSVLFAYLFLGEIFPLKSYFYIVLIIIGGFIVGIDEKLSFKAILSKNFLLFLCGIFFFAMSDIFAKETTKYMDAYNLKFWGTIIVFIISLSLTPFIEKEIKISTKKFLSITLVSFFTFIATLLLYRAFSYNITISQPIGMFGSAVTFLIAVVLSIIKPGFLEYHPKKIYAIRGIGLILMLYSAIMISII